MLLELFLRRLNISTFQIESIAKSDRGLVRSNNEDVYRELLREKFFIVADGMGGHNAGEVAAARAVEYMCSAIQNLFNRNSEVKIEEVKSQIASLIENTNLWVHHLGIENPKLQGMGTTLCSALFFKKFIIYSHVGDSRIYRFRDGLLHQLTEDHLTSQPNSLVETTLEFPSPVSSSRKVLSQAIGTSLVVVPEVDKDVAKKGDLYLLCSDGLSDLVSNEIIAENLANGSSLKGMADKLIECAKSKGGHDNITLVLIRLKK